MPGQQQRRAVDASGHGSLDSAVRHAKAYPLPLTRAVGLPVHVHMPPMTTTGEAD